MNYYFITGTSKGIGKALAEALLKKDQNHVVGISRTASINHPHYKHVKFDLAEVDELTLQVDSWWDIGEDAQQIILVNNAATLGEVAYLGNISNENLIKAYHLNVAAPAILINSFIKKFKDISANKIIIDISSGAGSRPVDGWAAYCSSKAALDMISRVAAKEAEMSKNGIRVFSVAPGIVDTEMQSAIRQVSDKDFSRVQDFVDYKNNNELQDAEKVAEKIIQLLKKPDHYKDVMQDVRKL